MQINYLEIVRPLRLFVCLVRSQLYSRSYFTMFIFYFFISLFFLPRLPLPIRRFPLMQFSFLFCLLTSAPVQVLCAAGQLRHVSEGQPALRVRLVRAGEEVLAAAGVHPPGEHLDARHHRQQPLRAPQDHQGNVQRWPHAHTRAKHYGETEPAEEQTHWEHFAVIVDNTAGAGIQKGSAV